MIVMLKYTSNCFYEYFSKELDDNMTLKEVEEYIVGYSMHLLKEYIHNFSDYTEEEKKELLNTFIREEGVCHWTIQGDVYS